MTKQIKVSEETHNKLKNKKENYGYSSIDEVIEDLLGNQIIEERFKIVETTVIMDTNNINDRCYHFENPVDAKDCCKLLNKQEQHIKLLSMKLYEI